MPDPGDIITNQILLNRLVNGGLTELEPIIVQMVDDLVKLLQRFDPNRVSSGRRAARVAAFDRRAQTLIRNRYKLLSRASQSFLVSLAQVQERWGKEMLTRVINEQSDISIAPGDPRPAVRVGAVGLQSRGFYRTILLEDPIHGAPLAEWWGRQTGKTQWLVRTQLRLGLANEETIDELTRRIRGRRVGRGFTGGVLQTTTRDARAIVRTAATHMAAKAHEAAFSSDPEVSRQYQYIATLDDRTTIICANLDGQVFDYDDAGAPRPPQHVACRSTIVPVVDWEGLGIKPPAEGDRASPSGPVSAGTDYGKWLRGQPRAVQNKVLGVGRAEMFRKGEVTLDQLVRRDGSIVKLADLT